MATLRKPPPDPDVGRARAAEVRRQADVTDRWSPARADWLRYLADGYEAGALDPTPHVHHSDDGPPDAGYLAARERSAAWMVAGGFDVTPPEPWPIP
jgi:hypothetical protein